MYLGVKVKRFYLHFYSIALRSHLLSSLDIHMKVMEGKKVVYVPKNNFPPINNTRTKLKVDRL